MPSHTEKAFEDALEAGFLSQGYQKEEAAGFCAETGLFRESLLNYIEQTQEKIWEYHKNLYGKQFETKLINNLLAERQTKTVLGILRHGFKSAGRTVRLAVFKPNTGMNAELTAAYRKNRFSLVRQVHFDPDNKSQSVDLVLALNGVPVVTMELKNPMTGSTIEDAKIQYCNRNAGAPLFQFKQGALVHFAVDPLEVWMTTHLKRKETNFLPFNQGYEAGPGNPPAKKGKYQVSYLWEDVLAPDSLLELVSRFLHLEEKRAVIRGEEGRQEKKYEVMIFRRFHQRDCVRALTSHAYHHGSGRNYLIQHSAGSGKSHSIAWLAYRLSSLHNKKDEKIFHSVIVISDRKVLDSQLQRTIYQFEHKQGVVKKIDQNTRQLAKALAENTPVIISTLQKFPFIMGVLQRMNDQGETIQLDMAGKRFAVIVDEAHSSQSGEAARMLRGTLNKHGIEAAIADQMEDVDDEFLSPAAKENMLKEMANRKRQPNLSFFAFTATPKFKTIKIFDEPGPTGQPPFHLYSMRQAIEEGFILDILKNYTTYRAYYGFIKTATNDPEVSKKDVAKKLARFAHLHAVNISQKVEVIVNHFRTHVQNKLEGRAKGMVVTSSRLSAVRFKQAFDKYIKDEGLNNLRALVAFSGEIEDPDIGGIKYTEAAMNDGLPEQNLPEKFAGPDYQVLIVADKYQTGFDEPLLSAMYVDKVLAGVRAVQTFSRLNRTMTGKEETFILDFVNDPDIIFEAFKPYYGHIEIGEEPSPQRLYDLQHKLMDGNIIYEKEIIAFAEIWFSEVSTLGKNHHAELSGILQNAVSRYMQSDEEKQNECRDSLNAFKSLYAFLSQIIPYYDSELEKLYTYARYLLKMLPSGASTPVYNVEDDVGLKYYRLEQIKTQSIKLEDGKSKPLKGPLDVGTGRPDKEQVELSEIINKLNDRFGTDFLPADEVYFDQIEREAVTMGKLQDIAFANSLENFEIVFPRYFKKLLVDRSEKNEAITQRLLRDEEFTKIVITSLAERVYKRILGSR